MTGNEKGPKDRHNPGAHKTSNTDAETSTAQGLRNPSPTKQEGCHACRYFDLLVEIAALIQEDRVSGEDIPAQRVLDDIETAVVQGLDRQGAGGMA
ncbi:hypothetical protein [Halomonas sp. HG01]|uniref:hypothetical protein n=1 Tax=Halomonas sp. HG01 TaxID=1609967 RepID=UPI000614661C|nr:hypothetical protein [Halomonas sp. HG01]